MLSAALLAVAPLGCVGGDGTDPCVDDPTAPGCVTEPEPQPTTDAGQEPEAPADAGEEDAGPSCTAGEEGCECGFNNYCNGDLECTDGTCVVPACVPGALGCPCGDLDYCDQAPNQLVQCVEGTCSVVLEDTSDSPGQPSLTCYTPCTESLNFPDGTFRYCSSEGYMEGCLAGLVCNNGSCVEEGQDPLTCDIPTDCPEHQACVSGRCLSNCQYDSECADDSGCYNLVCRKLCTASEPSCSSGFFCNTVDGEDGFCVPQLDDPEIEDFEGQELPFTISTNNLTFNNNLVTNEFTVSNKSDRAQTFKVAKVQHTETNIDGVLVETDLPLFWMDMGVEGDVSRRQSFEVEILPGEDATIILDSAFNEEVDKWTGRVEVSNEKLGTREIFLDYSTRPDGQWSGSIYYFINFADDDIDDWVDSIRNSSDTSDHRTKAQATGNAFLTEWTRFRDFSSYKQRQFDAMLGATMTGSWQFANVVEACQEANNDVNSTRCYLYASGQQDDPGVKVYADEDTLEIPTGVLEMPFTVRLQEDAEVEHSYTGRIESGIAMQYPGLPPATLKFAGNPAECEDPSASSCLAKIEEFSSTILVGARYASDGSSCAEAGYEAKEVPWLIEEFTAGVDVDGSGRAVRHECRETRFPVDASTDSLGAALNASLAAANPIPDGRVRRRNINLLDGIMINQDTLVMLVQESFEANLDDSMSPADFASYGIVVLRRSGGNIPADGFTPGIVPDEMALEEPASKMELNCSAEVIEEVTGSSDELTTTADWINLVKAIMNGREDGAVSHMNDESSVHYLCHDTGRFDGGLTSWDVQGGEACPLGSGVTFFIHSGSENAIRNHYCQGDATDFCAENEECPEDQRGTCAEVLESMAAADDAVFIDIPWACESEEETVCSDNRYDMREGKKFWNPADIQSDAPVFKPLAIEIAEAFRYKTRFKSRDGSTIGFVPDVCVFNSDQLPYCYDPQAIERAADRVTCVLSAYEQGLLDDGASTMNDTARNFLTDAFSQASDGNDGFEHLYAELLIMLGDEALTNAVASRFDLAGTQVAVFEGDLLEPDGIQLAGSVGNEMRLLYRSMQYFQMVMERFHKQSPALWSEITRTDGGDRIVTLMSISTYFKRLILASTRKAKVASEIARRYQAFNRADLARHVVERAYTEAYLESVTISQFMRRTARVLGSSQYDALQYELMQAQQRYTQALQRMREVYAGITDEVTFFGDAPDFIPFPAPGRFDVPSVSLLIDRAFETLRVAKEREERALSSNRAFDVDAAQFQAELARIKQQYESDLGDICGTFEGADGHIYPAIPKYAHLSAVTQLLGNPCGLLGEGDIYEQVTNLEARALDLRAEIQDIRDIHSRVEIEQDRVDEECNGRVQIAQVRFTAASQTITLQDEIQETNIAIQAWEKELSVIDRQVRLASSIGNTAQSIASTMAACSGINGVACGVAVAANATAVVSMGVATGFEAHGLAQQRAANEDISDKEEDIRDKEKEIAELNRDADYQAAIMECCLDDVEPGESIGDSCQNPGPLMVNSEAQVDQYLVDLMRAEIEAYRANVEIQRVRGTIKSLANKAERLMSQQEETEQHLINVEAARNDPNVRIYANADVLSADKSFRDALVDAYRATRMLEYYTATTYAYKGDLYLVRMAGRGEDNLEDYLLDLQRSFNEFEQTFGRPSLRVQLVSLRDDIFDIPRTDEKGIALLPAERAEQLRERLLDPDLLDDSGYIRVPFSTTLKETSPLTAIHKLAYVEAEIHGSDLGDRVGRLYLTSKGTSTIKSLEDEHIYHRMDPITAVLNPYFNGVRVFDTDIYRNDRLRDRPLVNSLWELTLNLRDESANADVNPNSITDVRLYLFYEDFTEL